MQTYQPLSLDQFYSLLAELKASPKVSKLVVDGLIGSCEVEGIDFSWKYVDNSLQLTITHKPWYVADSVIFSEISKQFSIPVR